MSDSLDNLIFAIRKFADERDWEQFHNPKNLAMALIVEAGELVKHFAEKYPVDRSCSRADKCSRDR
jgi:NTP pyrophosphatase (non-canonical NTP hydrolase)